MNISRRQRIITKLISIFEKNTNLYGHKTNLGSNVFEWKLNDFQEADLPGMSLRDVSETIEVKGSSHYYTLTIEIEAKVQASTSTTEAREVIADIMTIIGQNCSLGGLAVNVRPVENELLDFEQSNKKFGTISMTFEIQYITKAFQPYS
jgi:hypothetical protein